jgi:ABC-type glycerol-3-phosphate transport system substrate-binding protein
MKSARIVLALAAALALSGCASIDAESFFPEGKADSARYTRTGKFSSTTVEVEKFVKSPEKTTADRLTLKHSNAWIPNLELVIEGYERKRANGTKGEANP